MVSDATACPLPDGCADAVLCYFALINIESAEVQAGILAEVHRLLRPGGRAVVGHLPVQGMSDAYDAAKRRYCERLKLAPDESRLRSCYRPPIVLFSAEDLRGFGEVFSEACVEPSFNHLWVPGEPTTCRWRVYLCLTK